MPTFETPSGFTLQEFSNRDVCTSQNLAPSVTNSSAERPRTALETSNGSSLVSTSRHRFGRQLRGGLDIEDYDPETEAVASKELKRWLDYYGGHLESRQCVCILLLLRRCGDGKVHPKVLQFFERLKQIPELTALYTGPLFEKKKGPTA
ncbi:hypothetical protein SCAR479_08469 [Seiridium cardinale]|uniref:LAGLIDADG homing endonuclease n=1 Tax=Seiridium cardinale TaxID=138064 RepID=A0ABR2XMA9_9PEZI